MKHTYSFFTNEQKCIRAILDLHNGGKEIELDPMYNKGMFYKALIKKPPLRYDLNAESKNYDAIQGDAASLPLPDNSVGCMILDPPFMFGTHGQTKNSVMNKRYTMFDTFEQLKECYIGILTEAYRLLKRNGLLIFKCQDYTDGKTTMTHCLVWMWAVKCGFYAKDIAILNLPIAKVYNGNLRQRHVIQRPFYQMIHNRNKGFSTRCERILHSWRHFGISLAGNVAISLQRF